MLSQSPPVQTRSTDTGSDLAKVQNEGRTGPLSYAPLQMSNVKLFRVTTIFKNILTLTHSFQTELASLKH